MTHFGVYLANVHNHNSQPICFNVCLCLHLCLTILTGSWKQGPCFISLYNSSIYLNPWQKKKKRWLMNIYWVPLKIHTTKSISSEAFINFVRKFHVLALTLGIRESNAIKIIITIQIYYWRTHRHSNIKEAWNTKRKITRHKREYEENVYQKWLYWCGITFYDYVIYYHQIMQIQFIEDSY